MTSAWANHDYLITRLTRRLISLADHWTITLQERSRRPLMRSAYPSLQLSPKNDSAHLTCLTRLPDWLKERTALPARYPSIFAMFRLQSFFLLANHQKVRGKRHASIMRK